MKGKLNADEFLFQEMSESRVKKFQKLFGSAGISIDEKLIK